MSLSFASRSLRLASSTAVRSSFARPPPTPLPSLALLSRRSKTDELPQKPIDPYPLPLSHPVSQAPLDSSLAEETDFTIEPLDRSHEDLETTRKRLIYQARKRGMLEGDLLLATFARDRLGSMSKEEVNEFDRLLDEPDWDIYYWCTDKKPAPERWANSALLEQLRVHTKNEGKVVRAMPDLAAQPTSSV